jgi:hypothetical protein
MDSYTRLSTVRVSTLFLIIHFMYFTCPGVLYVSFDPVPAQKSAIASDTVTFLERFMILDEAPPSAAQTLLAGL